MQTSTSFKLPPITFPRWTWAEEIGYQPKTTYWQDFWIAAAFGKKAILRTFKDALKNYGSDEVYITEIALVTNSYSWFFYGTNKTELSKIFAELYHKSCEFVYSEKSGWNDEQKNYFFRQTD